MLKTLKEFEGNLAQPIFTKIREDQLILEKEHLSEIQTRVLGKYLTWNSKLIRVFHVKECELNDK
jgi:hypothetical protein